MGGGGKLGAAAVCRAAARGSAARARGSDGIAMAGGGCATAGGGTAPTRARGSDGMAVPGGGRPGAVVTGVLIMSSCNEFYIVLKETLFELGLT